MFNILKWVVSPVTDLLGKYQDRRKAAEQGAIKIKQMQVSGENQVTMTDAEAEGVMATTMNGSWKDEFALLLVSLPISLTYGAAVYDGIKAGSSLFEAVSAANAQLTILGVDYGFIFTAVILSAVGLKIWRR